jgi:hypothetical protein
MTKKEMYMVLVAVFEASTQESYTSVIDGKETTTTTREIIDFLTHEIELLGRKVSRKKTKLQTENDNYKQLMVDYLNSVNVPKLIKEIHADIPELADLSSQKVSRLLNDLAKEDRVLKIYEKKVPYFGGADLELPAEDEETEEE